jgi:hypothetical protein
MPTTFQQFLSKPLSPAQRRQVMALRPRTYRLNNVPSPMLVVQVNSATGNMQVHRHLTEPWQHLVGIYRYTYRFNYPATPPQGSGLDHELNRGLSYNMDHELPRYLARTLITQLLKIATGKVIPCG